VIGYIREQKVRRILVDRGSFVNIMPKSTMNDLGITVEELSKSQTMIQGFNLGGQLLISMGMSSHSIKLSLILQTRGSSKKLLHLRKLCCQPFLPHAKAPQAIKDEAPKQQLEKEANE